MSGVSFDELETNENPNLGDDHVHEESGSAFERVEQATDEGTSAQDLMAKAKEIADNTNDESATQAKTTENASDKQPQEAAVEINDELEKEMVNLVKAMSGDQEYELPENAMFKHMVDGEEVEVSLQDLKNNYSGQQAWDKRFSQLDTERKEFETDRQAVEAYVDQFVSYFEKGDEIGAMEFIAEISGMDPLQVRRNLREQFMREATERQGLSEAEIQLRDTREELNFVNKRRESEEQRSMQSQAQEEAAHIINGIQETFELSDQDLVSLYDSVVEKHGNDVSQDEIVNLMQEQANFNVASSGAEYLLEQVGSTEADQDTLEAVTELVLANPEFTEEDFLDVIKSAFDIKPEKKTSKKATKAIKKTQEETEKVVESINIMSFDDL